MTTLTELLGDLNDLLDDAANAKVSEAQKIRYINRGQSAMWPKVYQIVSDNSEVFATDVYEYDVPSTFNEGVLLGIEFETEDDTSDYLQADGREFDLVPQASFAQKMVLKNYVQLPTEAGSSIRFTGAIPLTKLTTGTDVYSGPGVTDELPVLYAMALATARTFEGRIEYERFNATQALNGILLDDISNTSNWWMRQFAILLEQVRMPMPNP